MESSFRLTDEQKNYIICWHKEGFSYNDIILKFEKEFPRALGKGTISEIIKKYDATNSVENLVSPGRPEVYSERYKRSLARNALLHQDKSIRDIEDNEILNPEGASRSTIQRSIISNNIKTIVRPKRLKDLTEDHMKKRKKYAQEHIAWTFDDWKLYLFADEADLFPTYQGKEHLRLKEEQKVADLHVDSGWANRKLTIKVWGLISYWGVGPLIRYYGSMERVLYLGTLTRELEPRLPAIHRAARAEFGHNVDLTFIDDNASCHGVPEVVTWKNKNHLCSDIWPSRSPDLNLIENVWGYLEDRLYEIKDLLYNSDDVWNHTLEIWNNINRDYIVSLYRSMPDRMQSLLDNRGGPIHY